MKMYLISDNTDTFTGMRLVGVDGVVIHTQAEVENTIARLLLDDQYGIILITEKLRQLSNDYISNVMKSYKQPLIIEIPDRHGFGRSKTAMSDFIKTSIGLKL